MVQGQPPLDVSVLCEGVDGRVWPVVAQQGRHLTLHTVTQLGQNMRQGKGRGGGGSASVLAGDVHALAPLFRLTRLWG